MVVSNLFIAFFFSLNFPGNNRAQIIIPHALMLELRSLAELCRLLTHRNLSIISVMAQCKNQNAN